MKHIFIVNKKSLGNRMVSCMRAINNICGSNKLTYDIWITESIEELKAYITQHSKKYYTGDSVFYAVGGDGTFNCLVNTVNLSNHIVQYLPFGTGNNAYKAFYDQEFNLKDDILSDNIVKADLGHVNDEYFTVMCGLGLDPKIGRNVGKFRNFPFPGKMKYQLATVGSLIFENKPIDVKLEYDEKTIQKIFTMINIVNGPTIGGNVSVAPTANPYNGKLHGVLTSEISSLYLLKLFLELAKGKQITDPNIEEITFEKIKITGKEPLLYEIDGEIRTANELDIKVCPKVLKLKGKR